MDKHLESEAISQTSKSDLRRKAEKIASENELRPFESLPLNEVQQILHELRVHQIELEIQNEELRRTQMELDVQRVRYCDLYDLAPIGYCTVNEKGAIVQANLTAVILLETTRDKLVNALFSTFILTEDQDIYYLFHRGMMEGINQEACILRMVKKGGTPFWAHVTATVIQNDKGISELRIVFYDITKHKEAEIALHEATRKYQLLADYAKECIFLKDTDGNYSYFSPASEEIFGYKPEEFVANASLMSQIIYPDDRDAYQYHLDHLDENDINELEFRIVRSDGCERWIAHYCNTVRDENGRYFGRRGTNRDITEKKLMELALVESEAKLHNVTSSAQDAVIMIDNDGKIIFWNEAAHRITGYSMEEVMGAELHRLITPERFYADHKRGFSHFRTTGEGAAIGKTLELEALHKEGYEFPIELSLSAVKLNDVWCAVAILRDISKRKEIEKKLHKSLLGTISAMSLMVEARDPYTAGHQKRVAALCVAIAKKMGMKIDQIEGLELAAKIHDIGKIKIPVEILIKPSALSELEFMLIKMHPESGYDMIKDIEFPWLIADMIRQHHEKLDGSGYPHGLKGNEILLEARIITVADIVEAISNHRPYRAALGVDVAMEIITQERGIKLDPDVVDACVSLFKHGEFCFL